MKKDIFLGILLGFVANAFGVLLCVLIFSDKGVFEALQSSIDQGILGKLITLGALLNLVVFFIAIKKRKLFLARGVLIATIFAAIGTMIQFVL